MASILQAVYDIPDFQTRYGSQLADHSLQCTVEDPANCWYCQLHKLTDGLLSGRYSQPQPASDHSDVQTQDGISPGMLKGLVGKGHQEFSTMRQQDAYEFFQFLCKTISQKEHANKTQDPTRVFDFTVEHRLQCNTCNKVRYQTDATSSLSITIPACPVEEDGKTTYQPVDFYECMDLFTKDEVVEGYHCPSCKEKTVAQK
jgi:ubiquitin carboxyl-terminal hydrolase 5/13